MPAPGADGEGGEWLEMLRENLARLLGSLADDTGSSGGGRSSGGSGGGGSGGGGGGGGGPAQRAAHYPSAIVLGMASHDMVANDIGAYRRNLYQVLWGLRYQQGYTGKIIWVTATPPVAEKQGKIFEAYKYLQTIMKTKVGYRYSTGSKYGYSTQYTGSNYITSDI
jgi:hypothetical protein